MNLKFIFYLLLFISLNACQSLDDSPRETVPLSKDTVSLDEKVFQNNHQEKSTFRYYDEVYKQTIAWNKAIDEQNYIGLNKLYAKEVQAYGNNFSKSDLIKEKMRWFSKYPNYHQRIENKIDVFFREIPINGTNNLVYGSTFTKASIKNGKTKRYQAELLFKEENGKLKINVETDLTSLLNIEKQTKGITLPDGKYRFGTDAFYDTRKDKALAHEQVRVSSEINFEIRNGQIQQGLDYQINRYSGYTRAIVNSVIVSGEIENNKIHIENVYYSDRDDYDFEYLKEKERNYTTIKMISKDKILILKPKQGQTFPLTIGDYLYRYPNK